MIYLIIKRFLKRLLKVLIIRLSIIKRDIFKRILVLVLSLVRVVS